MYLKTNPPGPFHSPLRCLQSVPLDLIEPNKLTPVKDLKKLAQRARANTNGLTRTLQSTLIREGAESPNFPNVSVIQSHHKRHGEGVRVASRPGLPLIKVRGPLSSSTSTSSVEANVVRGPRSVLQALNPIYCSDSATLRNKHAADNPGANTNGRIQGKRGVKILSCSLVAART